jgi:hypothetical protein
MLPTVHHVHTSHYTLQLLHTVYRLHATHCLQATCYTLQQFTLSTGYMLHCHRLHAIHCNSLRDTLHPHCNNANKPRPVYFIALSKPPPQGCVREPPPQRCVRLPSQNFSSPPFRPLIYSGHNKPRPVYFIALSKPYPQGCVLVFRPLIYSGHNIYIPSDSCITYNTQ